VQSRKSADQGEGQRRPLENRLKEVRRRQEDLLQAATTGAERIRNLELVTVRTAAQLENAPGRAAAFEAEVIRLKAELAAFALRGAQQPLQDAPEIPAQSTLR
jgi:hypothetical protein